MPRQHGCQPVKQLLHEGWYFDALWNGLCFEFIQLASEQSQNRATFRVRQNIIPVINVALARNLYSFNDEQCNCIICREFPMVTDWSVLTCQLNNRASANSTAASELLLPVPVSSVRPNEFLCPYETHCFALCMCCDFFACDCRMKCSDGCNCFHDQVSN